MSRVPALLILALCIVLSSCKAEVAGTGTGTGVSAGGVWTGTDPISNETVTGLIDEAGKFTLIRSDGTQYAGTLTISGSSLSSTFDGFTPIDRPFSDGSSHGVGTLTGTVQARTAITATLDFTTDGGTSGTGQLQLIFNATYDTASSLAAVNASYTDPASGTTVSIGTNGALSWQNASNGCVANGTIGVLDAAFNLYSVDFDLVNCQGVSAGLNGGQFTGFATLDVTASPEQLIIGTIGDGTGGRYSEALSLAHN